MPTALLEAKTALTKNEIPVGAIIVDSKTKEIIAKSHNLTKTNNDPLAHAEINVIRDACKKLKQHRLDGYDLYTSLEPCTMCAAAIATARIKRLYFATKDEKYGAVISNLDFFNSSACHHKVDYYYGFDELEAKKLLQEFFQKRRKS
jgi:tRNA(adenine34) deaminase